MRPTFCLKGSSDESDRDPQTHLDHSTCFIIYSWVGIAWMSADSLILQESSEIVINMLLSGHEILFLFQRKFPFQISFYQHNGPSIVKTGRPFTFKLLLDKWTYKTFEEAASSTALYKMNKKQRFSHSLSHCGSLTKARPGYKWFPPVITTQKGIP